MLYRIIPKLTREQELSNVCNDAISYFYTHSCINVNPEHVFNENNEASVHFDLLSGESVPENTLSSYGWVDLCVLIPSSKDYTGFFNAL